MEPFYKTVIAIAASMVLIVLLIVTWAYLDTKLYVEHGYSQVMLPGSNYTRWQK